MLIDGMKIKSGPVTFTVSVCKLDDWGSITYKDSIIRVSDEINEQCQLSTLFHEITHSVLYEAGYRKHDERMVAALASGWLTVLLRNPELMAVVRKAAKKMDKP